MCVFQGRCANISGWDQVHSKYSDSGKLYKDLCNLIVNSEKTCRFFFSFRASFGIFRAGRFTCEKFSPVLWLIWIFCGRFGNFQISWKEVMYSALYVILSDCLFVSRINKNFWQKMWWTPGDIFMMSGLNLCHLICCLVLKWTVLYSWLSENQTQINSSSVRLNDL